MTTENPPAQAESRDYCSHRCLLRPDHEELHQYGYILGPNAPVYSQRDIDEAVATEVAQLSRDLSDAYKALELYENLLDAHGIEI